MNKCSLIQKLFNCWAIHKMVPQSLTFYYQGVWRCENVEFTKHTKMAKIRSSAAKVLMTI